MKKWVAEEYQKETKIVLGWHINKSSLSVSLPEEKFIAYTAQVKNVIKSRKIDHENLENLIERLQRAL